MIRIDATARWASETDNGKQTLASGLLIGVGLVLVLICRGFEGPGLSDQRAGLLLGVLLGLIGIGTLIWGGKQIITVDPRAREIRIEHLSRKGRRCRIVPFQEVREVSVEEEGDRDGGVRSYHVSVRLRSGRSVALFAGFHPGRHSREVAEARCERLRLNLQRPK